MFSLYFVFAFGLWCFVSLCGKDSEYGVVCYGKGLVCYGKGLEEDENGKCRGEVGFVAGFFSGGSGLIGVNYGWGDGAVCALGHVATFHIREVDWGWEVEDEHAADNIVDGIATGAVVGFGMDYYIVVGLVMEAVIGFGVGGLMDSDIVG